MGVFTEDCLRFKTTSFFTVGDMASLFVYGSKVAPSFMLGGDITVRTFDSIFSSLRDGEVQTPGEGAQMPASFLD